MIQLGKIEKEFTLNADIHSKIKKYLNQNKSLIPFGNVDIVSSEMDFHPYVIKKHITYGKSLGLECDTTEQALLVGMGSMNFHCDHINGPTLLSLIDVIPMDFGDISPEYDGKCGSFLYQKDKNDVHYYSTPMVSGSTVIFDDGLPHGWLTNSIWMFIGTPINN